MNAAALPAKRKRNKGRACVIGVCLCRSLFAEFLSFSKPHNFAFAWGPFSYKTEPGQSTTFSCGILLLTPKHEA